MFQGYHFFDYKYLIPGYSGQDYDGPGRWIYLGVSLFLVIVLTILFFKASHNAIRNYLRVLGIGLIAFYLTKTIWESYYDIATGQGFNTGILPFDTCSLIMYCAVLAGFSKGKIGEASAAWLATGGMVGGISNLLFLRALNYYPFFTFGAFYSMIWHFLMVFTAVLLFASGYVEARLRTVILGSIVHFAFSLVVIPLDYIFQWDFMLYYNAGGVPLIKGLGEQWAKQNLHFLTTLTMMAVYVATFAFVTYSAKGLILLGRLLRPTPAQKEGQTK